MYTAETMMRFLGSSASDKDAEQFASYLINNGWTLEKREDGEFEAYNTDGDPMTEQEWLDALHSCRFTE